VIAGELHAQFIGDADSRAFTLLRAPGGVKGECTLVVPPFAEEMHKSRRIVTDFARRERKEGRGVVCVDLSGTGDSDGEFADARLARWIGDLGSAVAWSASLGWRVTSLLGVRFGALLASEFIRRQHPPLSRITFWQPVTSGARLMDQFLRIRVMASRMDGTGGETATELRARLKAGETIEVAGYALSGTLCTEIDSLDLQHVLGADFPPIRWIDVSAESGASVLPATQQVLEKARALGCTIDYQQLLGEPFWMSTEIVTNPALIAAS